LTADEFDRVIHHGTTVALADGVGMPWDACTALTRRAREVGGVRLITGSLVACPPGLEFDAFAEVRTFMAGYGLAAGIADGLVRYSPTSVSQLPALLAGPWRPDVTLLSAAETSRGLALGTEVSWIVTAAEQSRSCLVEVRSRGPAAARCGLLDGLQLTVVSESTQAPAAPERARVDDIAAAIGARVAEFVPEGAAIQFGPGSIGEAAVRAITRPVRVDSGVLTDAVVDLAEQGLLLDSPLGTYLFGSERLCEWSDGREVLDRIEVTHDPSRLAARPLVTINTALQIDLLGQLNIESVTGRQIAGIGGHADYVTAGSRSIGGLSIIAMPSGRGSRSNLVDRLVVPTSTPRSAVDIVVTEHGHADLRGRSDGERSELIGAIFPPPTCDPNRGEA
jgi:acyl-CoA hydrolase